MKFNSTKQFGLILVCLFANAVAFAQLRTPVDIATEHVSSHLTEWGLTAQDIDGMTVSDQYTDPTTNISRVFFIQRHKGIPVYNAIQNVSMTADGKVFHVGKRFVPNLAAKVNTTVPVLTAETAVVKFMEYLQLSYEPLRLKSQNGQGDFVFEKGNIAKNDIKAQLSYQQYGSGVLLSWDIALAPKKSSDMWSVRVDAVTGDILDQVNWTVYCKVDHNTFVHTEENCDAISDHNHSAVTTSFNAAADGTYNVWPWPIESPKHGPRTLVTDPHDLTASPYGWHDTNGQAGAEYTITRGNNVHAYEDSGANDASIDNEPNGGASLVFDFPYNALDEPAAFTNAAVVNLFYWNNVMHDLSYSYGMTEAAGNFQTNNYGNGGLGNDEVQAEAQDGGGTNNANFATPPDGSSGTMQMYLWGASQEIFNVTAPASVAGGYPSGAPDPGNWGAGAYPTVAGVSGEVVIVEDNYAGDLFSDGCDTIVNGADLQGKIALVDRGTCEFGWKGFNAQTKGALAVIICNFDENPAGMLAGAYGSQVNIPVIMVGSVVCQNIRQFAGNGLTVSIKVPSVPTGPTQYDGDLDNGVVAHEYGHGISTRLTGGPSQSGCLGNAEEMGEGWSDFFALVTTVNPGDQGENKRGVGTYAGSEEPNGPGIRRYPYSTDMSINPLTYGDVAANTEVHALGEVWTAMLWDLYWAFVDEYGWSPDLYHGTAGNNMAIRLVYEGLKNQPCNPGFIDGRNAIIQADQALNNGVNKCLIWKAFARRGAGLSADQGLSSSAADQTEAFDIPCECRDEVTISKSVTDFINAGEEITVTLNVANCKLETRTNVVVTDELPDGTTFKAGSASVPATLSGNVLTLQLGDINFEQSVTVTYKLNTSPDKYSIRQYINEVSGEDDEENWNFDVGSTGTPNLFLVQDAISHSPEYAWLVSDLSTQSKTSMEIKTPWHVTGNRPTMRFYHQYKSQPGFDAGLIDIKKPNENLFQQIPDKFIRNGYNSAIDYQSFVVPNLQGWSGTTNDEFIATYIDLSDWLNEDIIYRFRYATSENTGGLLGWVVDDIEFMDLLSYNGEACVMTDQGDSNCTIAPEEGTIVESQLASSTAETLAGISMNVFPNPAQDMLNVALTTENQQEISLSLLTIDGKSMMDKKANIQGKGHFQINVSQLPAGFYFIKVATKEGVMMSKVVVE